jgi:hypothetical protein
MTKKIAVVGSMINSSEYLLFKNLETGYSLERYDSVEGAINSDCDAVIVTDKDSIGYGDKTHILMNFDKPIIGSNCLYIHEPRTKCRVKDDRCVGSRLRNVEKETRILKHIGKDEHILRNQLCNILYTYYPCIDHIHIWFEKG